MVGCHHQGRAEEVMAEVDAEAVAMEASWTRAVETEE